MYYLSVSDTFSAAHRLCGYQGACSNLHGHNWKVRVCVKTDKLDEIGMALDFGIIKQILKDILDKFDHAYLNDVEGFVTQNPTSENLARHIFDKFAAALTDSAVSVHEVEICESERSSVVYKND